MKLFSKRINYTTLVRRGYDIVLPTDVYNKIEKKGYNVSLVINKYSGTVQLTKNNKYVGTLKNYMGVKSFKNGNPCDFHVSNLVK